MTAELYNANGYFAARFYTPSAKAANASPWHPGDIVPTDEAFCIVRLRGGQTIFLHPVNGKWIDKVEKWMYIPD